MDRPALDADALRTQLGDRWSQLEVVDEVTSTNADLLGRRGVPDRVLLAAEFQSAGRGRYERVWTSPPRAGITASFLFRPAASSPTWGWLPLLAGVALVEAVHRTTGLAPTLKWPNDVLLDGVKLAGILAQSADDVVVIGVGMNVATTADELPDDVEATSLALSGADVDRTALLAAIAERLDARVAQWDDCGGDAAACGLDAAYRERCDTLGRDVQVTTGDVVRAGRALDIDEHGHLVFLPHDSQNAQIVTAADVVHVRKSR